MPATCTQQEILATKNTDERLALRSPRARTKMYRVYPKVRGREREKGLGDGRTWAQFLGTAPREIRSFSL